MIPNANPNSAQSKGVTNMGPPERSQKPAIVFTVVVLGLWVLWSVYAEYWVEPVISIFEWFERAWKLDVLPGRES